jgi:hypothetical protein
VIRREWRAAQLTRHDYVGASEALNTVRQMDYGAAAAKYIDAFFANIQWDTVAKRLAA